MKQMFNLVNLKFWFWIFKTFNNKSRYFMWPMLVISKCQTPTNFHYKKEKKEKTKVIVLKYLYDIVLQSKNI
jgi:hypothetical protein